jgi:hypothetical protein
VGPTGRERQGEKDRGRQRKAETAVHAALFYFTYAIESRPITPTPPPHTSIKP